MFEYRCPEFHRNSRPPHLEEASRHWTKPFVVSSIVFYRHITIADTNLVSSSYVIDDPVVSNIHCIIHTYERMICILSSARLHRRDQHSFWARRHYCFMSSSLAPLDCILLPETCLFQDRSRNGLLLNGRPVHRSSFIVMDGDELEIPRSVCRSQTT